MAKSQATQQPDVPALAIFRRPTREDAFNNALATHLGGERVDMGTLAEQLDVSRGTLYRWFGSREKLMEEIFVQRAGVFLAAARDEAQGTGIELVLNVLERLAAGSALAQPVRLFIGREPRLALRVLTGETGAVHAATLRGLLEVAAETMKPQEIEAIEHRLDVIVQVSAVMQWVNVAIGEEPDIQRITEVIRELMPASQARARGGPARR